MEYIIIFIAAVFVNNIVLSQFLGICPFLGVSKKIDTAMGMGMAVTFVLTISTIVTFLIQKYILDAINRAYAAYAQGAGKGDAKADGASGATQQTAADSTASTSHSK